MSGKKNDINVLKKEEYYPPKIEIIEFDNGDVIIASNRWELPVDPTNPTNTTNPNP